MNTLDWAIKRYAWLKRRQSELNQTLEDLGATNARNPVPASKSKILDLTEQFHELGIRIDEITRTIRRLDQEH